MNKFWRQTLTLFNSSLLGFLKVLKAMKSTTFFVISKLILNF